MDHRGGFGVRLRPGCAQRSRGTSAGLCVWKGLQVLGFSASASFGFRPSSLCHLRRVRPRRTGTGRSGAGGLDVK